MNKTEEARLAKWVDEQRKAFREGKLNTLQIEKLLSLPNWDWISLLKGYNELMTVHNKRYQSMTKILKLTCEIKGELNKIQPKISEEAHDKISTALAKIYLEVNEDIK
jgi:hypothetical protein